MPRLGCSEAAGDSADLDVSGRKGRAQHVRHREPQLVGRGDLPAPITKPQTHRAGEGGELRPAELVVGGDAGHGWHGTMAVRAEARQREALHGSDRSRVAALPATALRSWRPWRDVLSA